MSYSKALSLPLRLLSMISLLRGFLHIEQSTPQDVFFEVAVHSREIVGRVILSRERVEDCRNEYTMVDGVVLSQLISRMCFEGYPSRDKDQI